MKKVTLVKSLIASKPNQKRLPPLRMTRCFLLVLQLAPWSAWNNATGSPFRLSTPCGIPAGMSTVRD